MVPLLEVLARHELPWWCYARSDALVNLSPASWRLVRKSRLKMAYIGAETPNDELLKSIRKGTRRADARGRRAVPPQRRDTRSSRSWSAARRSGGRNRAHVRVHSPRQTREPAKRDNRLHPHAAAARRRAERHAPEALRSRCGTRTTRRWYSRKRPRNGPSAAGSITPATQTLRGCRTALRRRIRDFVTVLRCRFPTVQDPRGAALGQGGVADTREVAVLAAAVRRALGARGFATADQAPRSPNDEPLTDVLHRTPGNERGGRTTHSGRTKWRIYTRD